MQRLFPMMLTWTCFSPFSAHSVSTCIYFLASVRGRSKYTCALYRSTPAESILLYKIPRRRRERLYCQYVCKKVAGKHSCGE
ncbi:hypothetical protein F4775DRAFT_577274 [Biscogniauxia sp. FL1348]|nr:hypothetical protein F4775DRAFT_577274 [Biscogniauxia sp. FL1348]